jgi:hypothetical protein
MGTAVVGSGIVLFLPPSLDIHGLDVHEFLYAASRRRLGVVQAVSTMFTHGEKGSTQAGGGQ